MRLDFIQKEVDVEKKLVQIEDQLNRTKLKIDIINTKQAKFITESSNNLKRNDKLLQDKEKLEEEIEVMDIKLSQKRTLTAGEVKIKAE